MQGLVTPQDLGFLQRKVYSTKSLLTGIWDMCKYVSRCAQINCMVIINVLCTWSVLKVKLVFLSVLWEQLCLDAMDNGVVTFTIRQIFAFEMVISIGIHAKGNFTGLWNFAIGFKLVMWFRRIDQHNVFELKMIVSVAIQAKENFMWVKYFATSYWSCEFATLTNRKFLGLKVTSVWVMLHTSLHYWQ